MITTCTECGGLLERFKIKLDISKPHKCIKCRKERERFMNNKYNNLRPKSLKRKVRSDKGKVHNRTYVSIKKQLNAVFTE